MAESAKGMVHWQWQCYLVGNLGSLASSFGSLRKVDECERENDEHRDDDSLKAGHDDDVDCLAIGVRSIGEVNVSIAREGCCRSPCTIPHVGALGGSAEQFLWDTKYSYKYRRRQTI